MKYTILSLLCLTLIGCEDQSVKQNNNATVCLKVRQVESFGTQTSFHKVQKNCNGCRTVIAYPGCMTAVDGSFQVCGNFMIEVVDMVNCEK